MVAGDIIAFFGLQSLFLVRKYFWIYILPYMVIRLIRSSFKSIGFVSTFIIHINTQYLCFKSIGYVFAGIDLYLSSAPDLGLGGGRATCLCLNHSRSGFEPNVQSPYL